MTVKDNRQSWAIRSRFYARLNPVQRAAFPYVYGCVCKCNAVHRVPWWRWFVHTCRLFWK